VTGIYKKPVDHPVQVTALGLVNDAICDTENHGGVDQAVYVYGSTDYDWWSAELGQPLSPGTFGENLTISNLESAAYLVGDLVVFSGGVVLEVTCPRVPCVTLAARMGDPKFVKRFRFAERPGLYCRVIQTGAVLAGESVWVEHYPGESLPAIEMFREFYNPHPSAAYLRRYLNTPTPIKGRDEVEAQLKALLKAG
jgi:MOSC domain-containing protein YiiM